MAGEVVGNQPESRVKQRRRHVGPLSGRIALVERGQDPHGAPHSGAEIHNGGPDTCRDVVSGDRHDAAVRLHERVVPGLVLEWTRRTVRGDRNVDHGGAPLSNRLVVETQPFDDTRSKGLHEDIGTIDQPPEKVLSLL
ncbi:MAG TPA: hypothetical protein DCG16_05875 [Gemmatimonadetes bacterium]|nr:hypothetical protein [Gemmatimonadota bacterium]